MQNHEFVKRDPSKFDSNCTVCEGKHRDSVHSTQEEMDEMYRQFHETMRNADREKHRQTVIERIAPVCVNCGQNITDKEFMRESNGYSHICCPVAK